jgi:hypothetical protein
MTAAIKPRIYEKCNHGKAQIPSEFLNNFVGKRYTKAVLMSPRIVKMYVGFVMGTS